MLLIIGLCMATHFDSPALQLLALMVDNADRLNKNAVENKKILSYKFLIKPLFQTFMAQFGPATFALGTSAYFEALKIQPLRYIYDRRPLRAEIDVLRTEDRTRVMIITNSDWDYAGFLLDAAFGTDWRNSFDLVVYRAKKKRGFFTGERAFVPFKKKGNGSCIELCDGNVTDLCTDYIGESSKLILYAGDDLWGDTLLVRKLLPRWHTLGIVEELEPGLLEPRCGTGNKWNNTTALFADAKRISRTPLGALANACTFCCADLAELLRPDVHLTSFATSSRSDWTFASLDE